MLAATALRDIALCSRHRRFGKIKIAIPNGPA
jgi:hypothetical protein